MPKDNLQCRGCVAVVDLASDTRTCVETLKGHAENGGFEEGYHGIYSARFASGDKQRITVIFYNAGDMNSRGISEYGRSADGAWQIVGQRQGEAKAVREGLEVTGGQGFDRPPLLVGPVKRASPFIWHPNPTISNTQHA